MVLQQKTLVELATKLPITPYELKLVKGFGKIKTIQFGEEVLAIIKTYLYDHDADHSNTMHESTVPYSSPSVEEILEEPVKKPAKKEKVKKEKIISDLVSFELFKSGHSIEEIALERGMTVSTIENHLGKYVEAGSIEIQDIISKDKIDRISEYYSTSPLSGIGQAKEILGESISYSEIRFFLKHLAYQRKITE